MTTRRDKTDEQEERNRRVRALNAKFQFYRKRVRPAITYEKIYETVRLQPATAVKIMKGEEQFDQPAARSNLVKIIIALALNHAMRSVQEANDFLQAGGFDPLEVMNKEDGKVINLLERREINEYDRVYEQGVPLPLLSRRVLIESHMAMVLSSELIAMMDDSDRYAEPSTTTALEALYLLLYKPEQDLLRRLGIFQDSCSVETAIAVCNKDDLLDKEALLSSLEALRQLNFIEIKLDQQLKFCYPYLQRYALTKLQEGKEYEPIRSRYIDYYHRLIKKFIFARYELVNSPKQLENHPIFLLLSQEKLHLYQAIEGMREKRANYIRDKMITLHYDEDDYVEIVHLLDLPPDILSDEEKGLVAVYKDTYEELAAQSSCPYPLLEWWWKHVEYELHSRYFYTPNIFAQWSGRLYVKYFS